MEQYKRVIIELLKASISKNRISFDKENNVDWNEVVEEARQHKISSLIYSSMDRNSFKYINKDILHQWKQDIFIDNLTQIRHINSISKLIDNLSKEGIEVLLLKGLVLRNFYPRPEYRTMCDADILVKQKDYSNVKNYLIKNGYECYENNHTIHEEFMCSKHLPIEVHWKIINQKYLSRNIRNFEEDVWKTTVDFNICGAACKTLCDENFLIHMCLHMAVHAKYRGFGLRQLYDIAVFIKNKNINWTSFSRRISLYGISKFTKAIFELLREIFDINVPKELLENQNINRQELQLLLNNVFSSGVHGKREEIEGFGMLFELSHDEQYKLEKLSRLLRFIFPTRAQLSYRYKYAKENILLLPIAWIHHAIKGIFIRKYGLVKMVKYYKNTLKLVSRRKEIIKSFEL